MGKTCRNKVKNNSRPKGRLLDRTALRVRGVARSGVKRIRNRVALGGHDVPEPDVRRRFARLKANLPSAIALADAARLYDNTDHDRPHREVAVLAGAAWWTAERLPGWAAAAIARMSPPRP